VHLDVLEKYVSVEKARDIYGVIFTGTIDQESLAVDHEATVRQRQKLEAAIR
jgi:N-methylhydantoinase B